MAALREFFVKPIDRSIDGVIKADDESSLKLELDEYIITDEIAQRLERFLNAYNNYDTSNGVWISGFFGSGKSHLLKILALLLENRAIDGVHALDVFLTKKEIAGSPMLAGALRKAVSIPSRSILFNIDQKAEVIAKSEVDALLSVFQKVFDEMCGYYGKQPHIAQFERDLDSRGHLAAFKTAYKAGARKPWELGREQALLEKADIAKAFAQATGGDAAQASDILGQYRQDTRISIEDFAGTVKKWLDAQGDKSRLNFFVDEVGQYIADNVKLMTNLQTIAESLNTKCRGRAWLLVTAQQDMASVIGDMTARQENDFSKIQERFRTRMPLNSEDVAEVIQRRLLAKTPKGVAVLGGLYDREEHNLRTLFDFADESRRYKNFRDRDHFVASYPFPTYQYELFQAAITGLSQHNAFEGKHSSVGERSMLGVFQDVAKTLSGMEAGGIATFDLMFEGIRSVLKSSAQQSIQIAIRNLDNALAIRVLKVLFLVKYVKEFKATARNIAVLLLGAFDTNTLELRRNIEEALNTLESDTYIQRNGEVYEFLTNEEKDVEAEIKAVNLDPSEITKLLEEVIFDEILRSRKLRHQTTGNEYSFSRKLDDSLLGREYELAINVITPLTADTNGADAVRLQGLARDELSVWLAPDVRLLRDVQLHKQTEKFIRQSRSAQQASRERIIAIKGEQNSNRKKDIAVRLRRLLVEAKLFVRGEELEIRGEDPQERIVKAFQTLVDKVYTNLPMLRGASFSEADLTKAATPGSGLFGPAAGGLTEAEQEVLNHVQAQQRIGVRVSAKALVERFTAKPYGWPTAAVLCAVASVAAQGKVEARADGRLLEGVVLGRELQNSHTLPNVIFSPQVEYTAAQIRKAKEIFKVLFDTPLEGADARPLVEEWNRRLSALSNELAARLAQRAQYPFMAALDPLAEQVDGAKGKPVEWFFTELPKREDALLDGKEQVLDPIRRFLSGEQKAIYDEARDTLVTQAGNFAYAGEVHAEEIKRLLAAPDCFKGNAIQNLRGTLAALKTALETCLIEQRQAVRVAVDEVATKLSQVPDFTGLPPDEQAAILSRLDTSKAGLDAIRLVPELLQRAAQVRDDLFRACVEEAMRRRPAPARAQPPEETRRTSAVPAAQPDFALAGDGEPRVANGAGLREPVSQALEPPKVIKLAELAPAWSPPVLERAEQVEGYVTELKKALLGALAAGHKVVV
jgi:hypothetical protein